MISAGREYEKHLPHVSRATSSVYGLSQRLGDVEFLSAHFTAHRFAPHSHTGFAVGAVRRGASRIWHRGKSFMARPGDLVLINPGAPHSADPAAHDAWDYCAVYFPVSLAQSCIGHSAVAPQLHNVVTHHPELATQLESLCASLSDDPEHDRVEGRFSRFIRELFTTCGGETREAVEEVAESAPWAARRYLDAHYADVVRIEQLADLTGRSPFGLIRDFSREFGMAPYTYLSHVRVARAQDLLRKGRPISDTAFSVGFSDQSHLTRFFRRVVGVPPGVWVRGVNRTHRPCDSQA